MMRTRICEKLFVIPSELASARRTEQVLLSYLIVETVEHSKTHGELGWREPGVCAHKKRATQYARYDALLVRHRLEQRAEQVSSEDRVSSKDGQE